jgi:hypothetical protein
MKAHEILSDESKWGKGANAVNAHGETVSPLDPTACKLCVGGALLRKHGYHTPHVALTDPRFRADRNKIINALCGAPITGWNDNSQTTYADVIKLLKELDI